MFTGVFAKHPSEGVRLGGMNKVEGKG